MHDSCGHSKIVKDKIIFVNFPYFLPPKNIKKKKHDLLVNKRYNWWTIGWSFGKKSKKSKKYLKNYVRFLKIPDLLIFWRKYFKKSSICWFFEKKKIFKKNCIFLILWENIFKKYTKCVSFENIFYYLGPRKNILKNPRFLGHLFYYKNNDLLMLKRKYF